MKVSSVGNIVRSCWFARKVSVVSSSQTFNSAVIAIIFVTYSMYVNLIVPLFHIQLSAVFVETEQTEIFFHFKLLLLALLF